MRIVAGEHDLNIPDNTREQIRNVTDNRNHELYDATAAIPKYDISLFYVYDFCLMYCYTCE